MHRAALGYPWALDCGLRPALWRSGIACVYRIHWGFGNGAGVLVSR